MPPGQEPDADEDAHSRERLIHDGNVPVQKDEFEDEAAEDSAGARADKASKPDAEDAKDKKDEVEKPGAAEKK